MPNPDGLISQAANIVADYFKATEAEVKKYSPATKLTRQTWNRMRKMDQNEAANEGMVYLRQYGDKQYDDWVNQNMLRDYEEGQRGY